MICGRGYDSARVMIVGDCGSEEDVSTGQAISGYTDSTISRLYRDMGIHDNDIYRTCYIKERGNQQKWEENIPLISNLYKDTLVAEIRRISPNIIVPLGELSFNFLTQQKGIYKFRGSILPCLSTIATTPTRVIPILGPTPYLNQDPKLLFISRLDFGKVAKYIDAKGPIQEDGKVWICKNSEHLRLYFERQYPVSTFLVFDIETYFGIPTCISFCFDGHESCTVPLLDWSIPQDTRVLMMSEVARMLASPIPKVNQNIKYDWKKLERWGFRVNNVAGDTIIAASCLYPEFPKNLGFLTSIYTEMPYFKDEGKEYDPRTSTGRDKLYTYCAKDSLSTYRIHAQQKEEMVEVGVKPVYDELMRVYPIYRRMDERGIRIDEEQRQKLVSKYESLFDINLRKLAKLCNKEINPLSPLQIRTVVYEELAYKTIRGVKKTKAGLGGTDEESLEMLMWMGSSSHKDAKDILRTIIACRKLHKVIEYLDTPIHEDGRMRSEFNLAGTENGRSSAGSTTDNHLYVLKNKIKVMDLGRSFQTITKHGFSINGETYGKDIRSMFVPSSGYSFVECDLSQAEARVDAVLARDFEILEVFDGPIGIHKLTGSWVYDCEPLEIKKNTLVDGVDRYHEAKTVRHAGERNMQAMRLMMMINKSISKCEALLRKFHEKQPNIRNVYHRDIRETLRSERKLVAPNGRKRDFFGKYDESMVNEGISMLPQAIVSDQLKFRGIGDSLSEVDWCFPLVEAHDGFMGEVPSGREEEFCSIFKRNVEVGIDFRTCSLPRDFVLKIPMEAEWSSTNWQGMKSLEL
jgi:uracil-DNA glycosylase family 4